VQFKAPPKNRLQNFFRLIRYPPAQKQIVHGQQIFMHPFLEQISSLAADGQLQTAL
jgi:hypothetical protein